MFLWRVISASASRSKTPETSTAGEWCKYTSRTKSRACHVPPKELKGFTKVSVKAGQSVNATIDLERDALAFYDNLASAWVVEKGKFGVLVASSSADVKLRGDIVVEKGFKFTGL
jgi:Fibronectin type III-like domain